MNRYDFIIIFMIASLAWGHLETLRFAYPIRLFGLFGLFFLVKYYHLMLQYFKGWMFFFIVWIVYSMASFLWCPDKSEAIIRTIHLILMFGAMSLMMISSLKSHSSVSSIVFGWALMVLITLPIAFWEIFSGEHLPLSYSDSTYRMFASVTFNNLNSYVVILCYALPFLSVGWLKSSIPLKFFLILLSIIASVIILINASRGGAVCVVLMFIIIVFFSIKDSHAILRLCLFAAIFVCTYFYVVDQIGFQIFNGVSERVVNEGIKDNGRLQIISEGIKISKMFLFNGGGAASSVPLYTQYASTFIKVPHNLFIEILVEYGFLILSSLCLLCLSSIREIWKSNDSSLRLIAAYVATSFVILFSIDDCYLGESELWMYFASLSSLAAMVSTYQHNNKKTLT